MKLFDQPILHVILYIFLIHQGIMKFPVSGIEQPMMVLKP